MSGAAFSRPCSSSSVSSSLGSAAGVGALADPAGSASGASSSGRIDFDANMSVADADADALHPTWSAQMRLTSDATSQPNDDDGADGSITKQPSATTRRNERREHEDELAIHAVQAVLAGLLGFTGFALTLLAAADEACGIVNNPEVGYRDGVLTRWPSTISELNSDWASARGRLFFGFMLVTSGLLYLSRMPDELDRLPFERGARKYTGNSATACFSSAAREISKRACDYRSHQARRCQHLRVPARGLWAGLRAGPYPRLPLDHLAVRLLPGSTLEPQERRRSLVLHGRGGRCLLEHPHARAARHRPTRARLRCAVPDK